MEIIKSPTDPAQGTLAGRSLHYTETGSGVPLNEKFKALRTTLFDGRRQLLIFSPAPESNLGEVHPTVAYQQRYYLKAFIAARLMPIISREIQHGSDRVGRIVARNTK